MEPQKSEILREVELIINEYYQHIPQNFSQYDNYPDNCVIAMDTKDAMDITLDDDETPVKEDGMPPPQFQLSLAKLILEDYGFEPEKTVQETAAWITEYIGTELVFFRFKDLSQFKNLDDVLAAVRTLSFWSPLYIMLDGTWYDTIGIDTVDDDGNTLGIRF